MKLLALDTSTSCASVALQTGERVQVLEQEGVQQHAASLLPMIDQLLREEDISIAELEGIVFGCGPGSFTGVRVACSIAKGLAYAHNLPVFAVSTLTAIREQAQADFNTSGPLLILIDARMNEVYWQWNGHEQVSAAGAIVLENMPSSIGLAGFGYAPYLSQLAENIRQAIYVQQEIIPHARAMLSLVNKGEISPMNAADVLPVYLRNQVT